MPGGTLEIHIFRDTGDTGTNPSVRDLYNIQNPQNSNYSDLRIHVDDSWFDADAGWNGTLVKTPFYWTLAPSNASGTVDHLVQATFAAIRECYALEFLKHGN